MNVDQEAKVKLLLTEKEFIFSFIYMKWKGILMNAICSCIILIVYFRSVYEMTLLVNIAFSIFLIFLVVLPLGLLILSYQAKKEYKSNSTFHQEKIMQFNDSGYTVISDDNNRNRHGWDYLHSVRETKRGFFLYYSIQSATYVPKRCFHSEEDIMLFKSLVSKHLVPKRVHLKIS